MTRADHQIEAPGKPTSHRKRGGIRVLVGALALATSMLAVSLPAAADLVGPREMVTHNAGACASELGISWVEYTGLGWVDAWVTVWKYDWQAGTWSRSDWEPFENPGMDGIPGFVIPPQSGTARWHALYVMYAAKDNLGQWEYSGEWVTFGNSYWCFSQ